MTTDRDPGRRALLGGLAALLLARPAAAALPPVGPDGTISAEGFMALSRWLTGHDRLDEATGAALRGALDQAGLGTKLTALYRLAGAAAAPDPAALEAAGALDATQALLRGWYVGLVAMPDGSDALVGYETTLAGAVVADFLALQSYCGGATGFWATPPVLPDPALRVRP